MDWERWGLRLVALVLFITLLTPELGAPPSDDTPIACTEEYLSDALRRFKSTIKAQKAVVVVGAASQGLELRLLLQGWCLVLGQEPGAEGPLRRIVLSLVGGEGVGQAHF